jgi:hypothetical protein
MIFTLDCPLCPVLVVGTNMAQSQCTHCGDMDMVAAQHSDDSHSYLIFGHHQSIYTNIGYVLTDKLCVLGRLLYFSDLPLIYNVMGNFYNVESQ